MIAVRVLLSGDATHAFIKWGMRGGFRSGGVISIKVVSGSISISTLDPDLRSPFSGTSLIVTLVLRDPPSECLVVSQGGWGAVPGEGVREVRGD